ncbi:tetratricopeptide repeat protein [Polynucleobacter paneuropaeus]|nr:tetratricopeptide repeat protein [Polynucleobacter paneuropaeus]
MLMNTLIPKKANPPEKTQVDSLVQLGFSLVQAGNFIEAKSIYEQVLRIKPNHFDALQLLGAISIQLKDFPQAVKHLAKAVKLNSNHPDSHSNLSNALNELKRFDEGLSSANKAINLRPNFAEAYVNRGNALKELKLFDKALNSYDKAISLKPDYVDAYNNRGGVLKILGRFDDALSSFEKAIFLRPNFSDAYNNIGITFFSLDRFDEAKVSFNKAIALNPNHADAYNGLANTLFKLNCFEEALVFYEKAILIKPDFSDAYNNIGTTLFNLRRFNLAIDAHNLSLAIQPDNAEALNNLGNSLQAIGRHEEALVVYDKAISIKSDYGHAYSNRANALKDLGLHQEAFDSYQKLFNVDPNYSYAFGHLLCAKLAFSDWGCWNSYIQRFLVALREGKNVALPFSALLLIDDPKIHLDLSRGALRKHYDNPKIFDEFSKELVNGKIRLGFFSPDLYYHPVSIHLVKLLECIDKSKFELFAFSFTTHENDPMRSRFENIFDHFIDVDKMSDLEVVKLSREMGVTIAFDLCGHTSGNRGEIFINRAAPIQVNYIGYPGTSGSECIDYLFSDLQVIPESLRVFYSEKIVYLPCASTYDLERKISAEPLSRKQFGLPEDGFVFACQNGNYKISPEVFGIWMDILNATPKSVLWLGCPNSTAVKNLIAEAGLRGITEDRLIFTQRESVPLDRENNRISRYLASYQLADLFLDTWPYGAGTTGIDAIYAGLPVLTKTGKAAVSRMATSYLHGIVDQELIVTSVEEYRDTAIELARNPEKLRRIKENLEINKFTTPLFNPHIYAKHFEDACSRMYERYQAGLPPDHIYVH